MAPFRIVKIPAISGSCLLAMVAMLGLATVAYAHENSQAPVKRAPTDNGANGAGRGGQAGMGPGMMGAGARMVPGYEMRPGAGLRQDYRGLVVPEKGLTTRDVRRSLEQNLARQGNKRLKVGEVKQDDDGTITADIVTTDNALVERLEIDRRTGRMQQVR